MSANIKTWQERRAEYYDAPGSKQLLRSEHFKDQEIAEWRAYCAALAATSPTVAVDECPCCESKAVMLSHTCRDCGAEYAMHGDVTANAASVEQAGVAIPEGWALVPVEPTEEMIQSACLHQSGEKYDSYDEWWESHTTGISRLIRELEVSAYRNMLAAAPSPDQQG